jgi:hypothetical protein
MTRVKETHMNDQVPASGLQLRSLVKASGELELSLASVDVPAPAQDEVVIRVEASPINPSDLGLLLGAADVATLRFSGSTGAPIVTADIPQAFMRAMAGRLDQSMPVGNEGAGVVVAAGASDAAQALLGEAVAVFGGAMYAQYRAVRAADCLVLPKDATPADGASCFVNPLTALGMVATMRLEGHTALVHTAAASNLGRMLVKICQKDGVGLVNIVRGEAQAAVLRGLGAAYVCNSSLPSFMRELTGLRRHGRHPGLRRHRRRQVGGTDSDLHGGGGEPHRRDLQPLRLVGAQAGLHLRRPRHRPDRVQPLVRHGMGRRRLAPDAVPGPGRADRGAKAARAGRG